MTKTTITAQDDRNVYLRFEDTDTGEMIELEIWAPVARDGFSSYVRYNGYKQLCGGLSSRGETLTYKVGTKLIDLVRREYRAMRATEKREAGRYA